MTEELDDVTGLADILRRDRYANLFFINDLDEFGSDHIHVYRIDGLYALNYRGEGLCLYQEGSYDLAEALDFLSRQTFSTLMGPAGTIEPFFDFFPGSRIMVRPMLGLEKSGFVPFLAGYETRILTVKDDFLSMFELWDGIEEFRCTNPPFPQRLSMASSYVDRPGIRFFGTFTGKSLVSTAGLSAIANRSAMVVGVATRKEREGRGYASHTLSVLLEHAFSELALNYVCLWHSNGRAYNVYRRLGFRKVGTYASITVVPDGQS